MSTQMDMNKETKMRNLYNATNEILAKMVAENHVDLNKYLTPGSYKTLNEVYEGALSSICNRQGMPKNIKFSERHDQFKEILFDFDPAKVAEKYGTNWELVFVTIKEKINPNSKMDSKNPRNQWVIFSKGITSASSFFSNFRNKDEFDTFVGSFQMNKYSREALPMLLSREIFGFGFALGCDFLKEAGYVGYPKPECSPHGCFRKNRLVRAR